MTGLPEIHLSPLAYTAAHWLPRDSGDPFDLNAPYQRGSVWTTDQRCALIKSLYMGLPVGSIIVSALPYTAEPYHWRIVDGKQRIEAIRAFASDDLEIPYRWLRAEDIDPDLDADEDSMVLYSALSLRFRRHFEMTASMPALEFRPEQEWLGRDASGKALWRMRSTAEILVAEAEVYGLINGAGTAQTETDMERARSIAEHRA